MMKIWKKVTLFKYNYNTLGWADWSMEDICGYLYTHEAIIFKNFLITIWNIGEWNEWYVLYIA